MKDIDKNPTLPYEYQITEHISTDEHINRKYSRAVLFKIPIDKLTLTKKQKERLFFLVGKQRIKKDENVIQIKIDYYQESYHNVERGMEMIEELYLETLRAP